MRPQERQIREEISARYEQLPSNFLEFAKSPHDSVRTELYKNPRCPEELKAAMHAYDTWAENLEPIFLPVSHATTELKITDLLNLEIRKILHKPVDERERLARIKTLPETLIALAQDPSKEVRIAVAENPICPVSLQATILEYNEWEKDLPNPWHWTTLPEEKELHANRTETFRALLRKNQQKTTNEIRKALSALGPESVGVGALEIAEHLPTAEQATTEALAHAQKILQSPHEPGSLQEGLELIKRGIAIVEKNTEQLEPS